MTAVEVYNIIIKDKNGIEIEIEPFCIDTFDVSDYGSTDVDEIVESEIYANTDCANIVEYTYDRVWIDDEEFDI